MTLYYAKISFTDSNMNFVFQGQTFFCNFYDLPEVNYSTMAGVNVARMALSEIWGEVK